MRAVYTSLYIRPIKGSGIPVYILFTLLVHLGLVVSKGVFQQFWGRCLLFYHYAGKVIIDRVQEIICKSPSSRTE